MKASTFALILSGLVGTGTGPVRAETTRQQWLTLTGEVALDRNDSLSANAIFRSAPDSFDIGQRLLRAGYTRKLDKGLSLNLAYTHVRSFVDNGPDPVQHRLSQSISMPLAPLGQGKLEGRVQFEEIIAVRSDDLGIRFRPRKRWQRKLDTDGRMEVQFYDELILSLNSTDFGQASGFTANRLAGSLRFGLDRHFGIAPGYTWQLVNRRSGPTRNDHILGLTLDARY